MRKFAYLFVGLTCLASLACAPESASEDATDVSGQEAALTTSGKRVCKGAFFDRHPVETVFTDSAGGKLPMPYAACDTTMTLVLGAADYATIAARTAGSGYSPVRLASGKAAVALYLIDFGKSDVGSYREFELTYAVLPDAIAAASPELPLVNEMSAAAPFFIPGVGSFMDIAHVDVGTPGGAQAVRSAIESVGLDKRTGDVDFAGGFLTTFFDVDDQSGAAIVDGHVGVHRGPIAQLVEGNKLAKALGLANVFVLPPTPAELNGPLVNVDHVHTPSKTWLWAGIIDQPKPILTSLGALDRVHVGASSEIGGILEGAHFDATASIRYENVDVVYSVPAGF